MPALLPRRTDGFSDDGLSYSVAGDFDKAMGQAMAQYEARTGTGGNPFEASPAPQTISEMEQPGSQRGPRYNPFGPSPDDPVRLRQELIDPVLQSFGAGGQTLPGQRPITAKSGSDILERDPLTGAWNLKYKGEEARHPLDQLQLASARDKQKELNLLRSSFEKMRLMPVPDRVADPDGNAEHFRTMRTLQEQIGNAEKEFAGITAGSPATPAAVSAPPDLLQSRGFIGGMDSSGQPAGANRFVMPGNEPSPPIETAPAANEVVKPLKNGRHAVFNSQTRKFIRYAD